MKIDNDKIFPQGNDYTGYSRELLIEIVEVQKEKIQELLEEVINLRYKLRTSMEKIEFKPIIHERSKKGK